MAGCSSGLPTRASSSRRLYWAQVEGEPDDAALEALRRGVKLKDGLTRPARVRRIADPTIGPREPPIRVRRHIPTSWLALTIGEGRNRQVRRMTAAVGHPTLRLVRVAVGGWRLDGLGPGEWREVTAVLPAAAARPRSKSRRRPGTAGHDR